MKKERIDELRSFYYEHLMKDVMPFWMQSDLIDKEDGGFITSVDRQGKSYNNDKSVWFQGRCLWTFSKLCNVYGEREEWAKAADSGAEFIKKYCIDESDGRMFFTVTKAGKNLRKRRYFFSESFLVVGFAEYYLLRKNPSDLALAEKYFDLMYSIYTNDGSNGEREISISEPFLAHEDLYEELSKKYYIDTSLNIVDMHPYVDPVTGDKYMYFNSNALAPHTLYSVAEIFVVKVGDKDSRWTDDWQWETVKQLTRTGYVDMGENENAQKTDQLSDLGETDINEGPYVIYNETNGKYYLTISKGRWQSSGYSVIQAIGDSPMGPFKKFSRKEGGILLQTETHWDHVVGPGHHSLIKHKGKTYIVYHQHVNKDASGDRAISMDEIKWIQNQNGEWIMYCNGATKSPQLRLDCGYSNIADKATVSVSKDANGTKASLTDGLISATSELDFVKEFTATGNTVITLDFGEYRTVRGLMIYNSREYEKAFNSVRRIEFDFTGTKDGQKVTGTAYIDNLAFNQNYFYELYGSTYIRPGTAAIAEFEEMHVKSIRIIVSSKTVNVSEIVVIGK